MRRHIDLDSIRSHRMDKVVQAEIELNYTLRKPLPPRYFRAWTTGTYA
jgi:hypothetical protein